MGIANGGKKRDENLGGWEKILEDFSGGTDTGAEAREQKAAKEAKGAERGCG